MSEESVKVAVRVRPFNSREKQRNAVNVIEMDGKSTVIKNLEEGTEKSFTFDYSYWSHDGFEEKPDGYLSPTTPEYADQQKVFDDLGQGVLENAWNGYNCSLFAYGQTGSGKSYSMVGYGVNRGIVPVTCDELFKGISGNKVPNAEFNVSFSMLEIYNEQVQDLLGSSKPKGGLKVRQHPKKGFYVNDLRVVPVHSFAEIEARIEEGTKNRTIAATNMNATSSRAHTIVTVNVKQKTTNEGGVNMTKSSSINLVDLAGSERAESTGAQGDRLKEGAAINQSLSTLGNVISALVDVQNGKKKIIPFRDSVLTKLLKNALGGNSKTIMIAALSPADINYDETLSTLRFADRVKSIKTQAVVNETPTERLIRELREENARLMAMLQGGALPPGLTQVSTRVAMAEELKRQMEENQREMQEMKKTWEQRLEEEKRKHAAVVPATQEKEKRKHVPHLWNMNEDPALSCVIAYFIEKDEVTVGNGRSDDPTDIVLKGLSIAPKHAIIHRRDGKLFIKKAAAREKILVNGKELENEPVELRHHSRVLLGPSHLYCMSIPGEAKAAESEGKVWKIPTFEDAQAEIARHSGLTTDMNQSPEQLLLQEEIETLLRHVTEANAISTELNKDKYFSLELVQSKDKSNKPDVKVLVADTKTGASWIWSRNRFMNRKYAMLEMFNAKMEEDPDWDRPTESDPFFEALDKAVKIGFCNIYLQPLCYKMDLEESVSILDHNGQIQGHLDVHVFPCRADGSPFDEDEFELFVDDPDELVGHPYYIMVSIKTATGLPPQYSSIHCSYKWFDDEEDVQTPPVQEKINANIEHSKIISIQSVCQDLIDWMSNEALVIEIWGDQTGSEENKAVFTKGHTLASLQLTSLKSQEYEEQLQQLRCEMETYRRRSERISRRHTLIKDKKPSETVTVADVKSALSKGADKRFKGAVQSIMVGLRAQKWRESTPEQRSQSSTVCSVM
ncbi:kinesin family member 12 [Salpingoeca rosetta]|uniref:Kinesin-like protein n=1 Tax=Salpingoeca rosetta (strain ATCC 50818 / BSB-021) TaxID=946362 RepID=F2TXN9_SALR5|nr:kinesin family member 12 [Salpingoeca rosetta]EGD76148.1 kinesin family member 12 [Salpingoeca rosetta]|eukprot:XP_004998323.1 kinesin family member 12 [Salpingoeca rosetta]